MWNSVCRTVFETWRMNKKKNRIPFRWMQEALCVLSDGRGGKSQIPQDIFVVTYITINWFYFVTLPIILPICEFLDVVKRQIQQI